MKPNTQHLPTPAAPPESPSSAWWPSFLLLLLGCLPQPGTAATPTTLNPSLVSRAQSAEQAVNRLGDLQGQAQRTRSDADALERRSQSAEAAWQRFMQADQAFAAALASAKACMPALQQRLAANESAMRALQQAVDRSQSAVASVARSEVSALLKAAQSADTAFAQRSVAEAAFASAQQALQPQASPCAQGLQAVQRDQVSSEGLAQAALDQARAIAPARAALRQRWAATAAALDAATQARWLSASAPALAAPDQTRMAQLTQALATLRAPDSPSPVSARPTNPLAPPPADLDRLWSELARLQDAASYAATTTDPAAGGCEAEACQVFATEQRTLAARIAEAEARLSLATDQWRQAPALMADGLAKARTAREALADRLAPIGQALGPAAAETRQESQAIAAAASQLIAAAQPALEQARRQWQAAYRLAHGRAPDTATSQAAAAPSSGAALPAPAMPIAAPDIRSHAYHLFSRFDSEIAGFGAYTYVLVRSGSDMAAPSVRRRFDKLLTTLQQLPRATLVPADQARLVNVFCIPVQPGAEETARPGDVLYGADLGQQLKLRAQNGLLTHKAVQHRLTNAPGPFLLTLPMRLADAQSATPVLIADLSTYPEDAIADLNTHYMNGLVDDFPAQQVLWQPPRLQRVALFMIHLASATGQLVESAMHTAHAEPR